MHKWNLFLRRLLAPSGWLILGLSLLSVAGLITVFTQGLDETALAYGVYVLSAYTLTVLCIFCATSFPKKWRALRQWVYRNPYGSRYLTDVGYKVRVSLYLSLAINLIYSTFKLVSGIVYASAWMWEIAVYYILLSAIRFLLLRYMRSGNQRMLSEWKRYRLCGILMIPIHLSLSGIVVQMVWQNKANLYHEIVIITLAAYAFYSVTMSVIDVIKYRKYERPVITAAKIIRFAAALVSLLTVEAAMLAKYGEDEAFRRLMIGLSGGAVSVIVLVLSVGMIVKATKHIKHLKMERT